MRHLFKVFRNLSRNAAFDRHWPVTAAAKTTMAVVRGPEDIDALYMLFLGRLPESDAVREGNFGRSIPEVAERVVTSEEFATQIVDRFIRQKWLPHQTLSLKQLSTVTQFVVDSCLSRTSELPQADWRSVLRSVLSGEACGAAFKGHYGEMAEQFLELLEAPESPIVAGIELIANTLCRGWVVNQNNPTDLLHLRVRLNGLTVNVAAADEYRRDVQARYGGEGRAGFTIRVDLLPGAGELREATLEIIELSRGTVVLPECLVALSPAPARHFEASLRQELIDLRRAIDRLEGCLPRLENGQAWPLSAYAAVQPLADLLPSPPTPGTGDGSFCILVIDDPSRPQSTSRTLASVLPQADAADQIVLLLGADAPTAHIAEPGVELSRPGPNDAPGAALNRIARQTTASHLLILDAGVALAGDALAWLRATARRSRTPVIYSDEDRVLGDGPEGEALRPVFRPAFDPELLSQRNYIGNVFCTARQAFIELEGFTGDPSLDPRHDFLLRAAARYGRSGFTHLPLVLAHIHSAPTDNDDAARGRLIRTVQSHLERTGSAARAVPHDDIIGRGLPDAVKIVWPQDRPRLISVIVPTRDSAELVSALVASLQRHTMHWDRIEIIVVCRGSDPGSRDAFAEIEHAHGPVRVVSHPVPFNWGAINNTAATEFSTGELLVFLNDDMLCVTPGWDDRLRGQLQRPDIAVLGGRLLYPNGAIQHAGIVFGDHAQNLHEGAGGAVGDGLYLDRTLLVHETAAVTGAFLACRRDTFDSLGGFDAERFTVTCSDVDFCVRAHCSGDTVLYDPFLTWIHYESTSRGFDHHSENARRRFDLEFTRWRSGRSALDLVDLHLNPHLVRSPRPFEVFHSVDAQAVDTWLAAQQHRCRQSAARQAPRRMEEPGDDAGTGDRRPATDRLRVRPASA